MQFFSGQRQGQKALWMWCPLFFSRLNTEHPFFAFSTKFPPVVGACRDERVELVPPAKAPRLGKAGTPESRVAILHSLAHIESWAIDLSWWGRWLTSG